MTSRLVVWWEGLVAGQLLKRPDGKVQFAYDPAWLANPSVPPLSASMPKVPERYGVRSTMAFFNGLLPEGRMREAMAKSAGGDVAGAIQHFSFLYSPVGKGGPRPAPLYDLLSTARDVGGQVDQRFAMKIGQARTLEEINSREWRHFAQGIGVTHAYLRSRVLDLAQKIQAAVGGVASGFEHGDRDFLRELAAEVSRRAQLCVAKCTV